MTMFKRAKDSIDDYRRAQEPVVQPATIAEKVEEEAPAPEPAWRRVSPVSAASAPAAVATPTMDSAATVATPAPAAPAATVVAKDSTFSGKLKSDGSVRVEGVFDGEIEAGKSIYIAENARATARLKAAEVVIAGSFDGQVDCASRLHLTPTARTKGSVQTPALLIEEGAVVDCHFSMTPGKGA